VGDPTSPSARWWKEETNEAHTALFTISDFVRMSQQWQADADLFHAEMYAGPRAASFVDRPASSRSTTYEYVPTHLARNVSRSAVDTYTAKIFKHRPLPEVLADKGNWRDQRRAKKMTQLVEGEFDRHKIFKKWNRIIGRDSGIFGRGILKIDLQYLDAKTIRCDRVLPRELYCDPADAKYGEPRNMYLMQTQDIGVLVDAFAKNDKGEFDQEIADAITQSGKDDSLYLDNHQVAVTVDRARVCEAWHLCDNVEAHEEDEEHDCTGRHIVCLKGVTLVDETWPFQRFPLAILNYLEPLEGAWPAGLCERLEGYQYEQNLMSEKVSDSHYFSGGGIIYVPNTGDLVEEDFTNGVWKILRGAPGMEPKFFSPDPLNPQTYEYMRDIGADALAEEGISQMSAQAQKPAGVTAAVALNTLDDIETERFSMQGYGYAQWCVDVAELFLMWIQHIVEKHGDYTSRVPLRGGIVSLNYKDVSVDNYIVRVAPSALMKLTPAARKQMVQDLFNAGRIDGTTFLRYIADGAEDIESEIDTQTAVRLAADEQIEAMLDAADPSDPEAQQQPSPYSTELAWTMARAQERIAQAKSAGCPNENIELVMDYVLECDQLLQKQNPGAPQAPAQPVGPGGPGQMETAPGAPVPMAPGAPPPPPPPGPGPGMLQ